MKGKAALFIAVCQAHGLPLPEAEHKFHPTRKWRFDFAWPDFKVALENDGGVWINGGHNRGSGWKKDTDKRNTAAELGWRLLRCTPNTLCTLATIESVRRALAYKK